jgi:hypothetical protein
MHCPICQHEASLLREVHNVAYFRCHKCESFFAHPDFLAAVDAGAVENYRDSYWDHEISAARERSFGPGVVRMAETLRMARIPIRRALDIGTGPGFLLDALAELVPSLADRVHGVERFPPPQELLRQLAEKSNPGALYFFNSGQPSFVETADPGYLSPYYSGHLVAWSIAGARVMFERAGFNVIALPGRDWAFLAEFGPPRAVGLEKLVDWLWRPAPENIALVRNDRFGPLFETLGLECARCYLEAATAEARAHWAHGLQNELRQTRRRRFNPFARE